MKFRLFLGSLLILSTVSSFAADATNTPALPIFLSHLNELQWNRGGDHTLPIPIQSIPVKLARVLTADNLKLIENKCVAEKDGKTDLCTISFDSTAKSSDGSTVEVVYTFSFEKNGDAPTGSVSFSTTFPSN